MATQKKTADVDYSMQEKIMALYELQKIDSKIDEINKVKGELPLEVQDLEDEMAGMKTRIEHINAEIEELNTLTKQRKREVDQAKIMIGNYKEQQNNVRNNREFDAITKEIEYQELEIELAEKRLKEYSAGVKAKKLQLEEAEAVADGRAADLAAKKSELEGIEAETAPLVEIASCCDGIAAIVGLPILTREGTISAAALIQDRKVLRYVGKKYISARREMGFLVPSKGFEYATIKGHKCAIIVGDDLSREHDFDKSVETVISINARKYGKGAMTYRYDMMRHLSFVEAKNIVLVNQVGGATDIVYDGTSGAFNNRGELVLMMKQFEEDFQIFDTKAQNPPVGVPSTYNDRTRMVYQAARCGLRDFFLKNGYKKACIGLSGGIDSAVVACLAADALGAGNVRALLLPSQFSSDHSVEDAKKLAENLGIEYNVIPITEIYTSVVNTLKPVIGGREFDATEENIQTRIRTVLLMAVQNKTDYILLNSSNKSENALGLCTLYGDTAGAFSPTGDLYKSEMYDVARYINRTFGNVIPENILDKEPSSELHPGQKDSDILPPYEVVDAILLRMIEEGQHREEIVNAGFDSEVVEKIHCMIMRNEKKRYQFPPVLRLSMCSFGHERLMPLTNKYGD